MIGGYFPEFNKCLLIPTYIEHENYLRLPLPIDPVNPERGLLGMCPTPPMLTPIYEKENSHEESKVVWWEASWPEEKHGEWVMNVMGGATFTRAMLKAIAHQWGIEVPG